MFTVVVGLVVAVIHMSCFKYRFPYQTILLTNITISKVRPNTVTNAVNLIKKLQLYNLKRYIFSKYILTFVPS